MVEVIKTLILFTVIFFISLSLAMAKDATSFHSNKIKYGYLKYETQDGDWPVALLRRLNLQPIFGPQGSLEHFFNLNEEINESYGKNPKYKIPKGTVVYLPVTRWEVKQQSTEFDIKEGFLVFNSQKEKRQTNDYTKVLNLKNMAKRAKKKKFTRAVASTKQKPKKKKSEYADFNYQLGKTPIVRVPVEVDSPLYKLLQQAGFAPLSGKLKGVVYVDIPLSEFQQQRRMAAVNTSKIQAPSESKYNLSVSSVAATRLYQVVDNAGQTGDIGIDPGLGARIGFKFKTWVLNMEALLDFQTEKFQPDSAISINQETDQRLEFLIRQSFDLNWLDLKAGVGMTTTPSFVSANANTLNAKHLLRPFIHLGGAKSFAWGRGSESSVELGIDYLLGAEEDVYALDSGYRGSVFFNNRWAMSNSLSLVGDVGAIYQDDNPKTYQQTQFGMQVLLGVQWNFGGSG